MRYNYIFVRLSKRLSKRLTNRQFFVGWDLFEAAVWYKYAVETHGWTLEELTQVFESPVGRRFHAHSVCVDPSFRIQSRHLYEGGKVDNLPILYPSSILFPVVSMAIGGPLERGVVCCPL